MVKLETGTVLRAVPELVLVGDGYSAVASDLKTSAGDFPTSNPMAESRFQTRLKHLRDFHRHSHWLYIQQQEKYRLWKRVTRAGIEPTAAAPSQPTRLDGSRSDHSVASKKRLRDELAALSFSFLSHLSPSDQPPSTVSVRTVALKLVTQPSGLSDYHLGGWAG